MHVHRVEANKVEEFLEDTLELLPENIAIFPITALLNKADVPSVVLLVNISLDRFCYSKLVDYLRGN